jgi:hypothetical protein
MERFPVLGKADLDETQRALWDELTLGPRGFYTGGAEASGCPTSTMPGYSSPSLAS